MIRAHTCSSWPSTQVASLTKAIVLKVVLFHTALDQFPKPLTFQMRTALSHSHSHTQKSARYFLGKLPAKDMSENVMFSLILSGGDYSDINGSLLPGHLCDL